ncbi:hypothetical protein [Rosistilla oblonga]|uniref:hypothetical protein n=1 Tax=Rosistilla oblonga TaxID=2527990 RepID=UPI003A970B5B
MSSPRTSRPVEGRIHCGDRCMGPIKLPLGPSEEFLDEFNRLYGGIQLRIEEAAATPTTAPTTGDN